jgi:xanthine dehydrogenase accessory factor
VQPVPQEEATRLAFIDAGLQINEVAQLLLRFSLVSAAATWLRPRVPLRNEISGSGASDLDSDLHVAPYRRTIAVTMTTVWPTIERFLTEHGAAVLVTVAESAGSTPREVGARMVVRPDGRFHGTIGGGALEWLALAEAQQMMARSGNLSGNMASGSMTAGDSADGSREAGHRSAAFRRLSRALGPELGQCCGGRVVVTLERFDRRDADAVRRFAAAERAGRFLTISEPGQPARRSLARGGGDGPAYTTLPGDRIAERFGDDATPLWLFGAGHVGRNLALALAPLPFTVTWIDPRPGAFPAHVPGNVTCRTGVDPAGLLRGAPDDAFVAVMTHSHALDLDVIAAALLARRFGYVGLIGSATKRARFTTALRAIGLGDDDIAGLVCPIGLTQIRDKAPAAIALAVAAQLLIRRDALAAAAPSTGEPAILSDGASHG